MSEYQSFCWATVGRALSNAARKEVGELSSHISVSATGARVDYHWGSFKHDPIEVLIRFFDVFTYEANWGSQILAFRFDAGSVPFDDLQAYAVEDIIDVSEQDGHLVVKADFNENWQETDCNYGDERGAPGARFVSCYEEILAGDYRCLFLLWLRACEMIGEGNDEVFTAPVPAGLGQLDSCHEELLEFIEINSDLLDAAKALSKNFEPAARHSKDANLSVEPLGLDRQRYFLERLLTSNPAAVKAELIRELGRLGSGPEQTDASHHDWAVFSDLAAAAARVINERDRKTREEEERKRRIYLDALAANEERLWSTASRWVTAKNTKAYDIAVLLLKGLEDLAIHRRTETEFHRRARELAAFFPRLTGFRERMMIAGFIGTDLNPYQQSRRERWREGHKAPIDLSLLDRTFP